MTALDVADMIDTYSSSPSLKRRDAFVVGRQIVVAPVVLMALNVAEEAGDIAAMVRVLDDVQVIRAVSVGAAI